MLVGVIADDFTGASDIANTLAKGIPPEGGLLTAQFVGVPTDSVDASIEAGVISLKSRSIAPADAVRQSLAALAWLKRQGCKQFIFKYCSTFDSTPEGNIGPVGEALADALGVNGVVVCPAFPDAGRTVYQAHLFVFDQLLNESGMQDHPLTPMSDANLKRWLGRQCNGSVGHVPLNKVRADQSELRSALSSSSKAGDVFCVVDALTNDDLIRLGAAAYDHVLISGGSGVAMGLPRNFHQQGLVAADVSKAAKVIGPGAILAGSCSGATRAQITHHAKAYPTFEINVEQLMSGVFEAAAVVDFIQSHIDTLPLVYSSASPAQVGKLQAQYGAEKISTVLDELFSDTACALLEKGYTRLVVAGGETSSAVALRLSAIHQEEAMCIGDEIDPGVPVLYLGSNKIKGSNKPIALALKSGNFGGDDFFAKAFAVMAGES